MQPSTSVVAQADEPQFVRLERGQQIGPILVRAATRLDAYGTTVIVTTPVASELSFLICVVPTLVATNLGV